MLKALIICGFPGIGKSTAEQAYREAIDCESSAFHYVIDHTVVNANFPAGVEKENPHWVQEYVDFIENAPKMGSTDTFLLQAIWKCVKNWT